MPKFIVYYKNNEYGSIEVDANTEDEARDMVEDMWEVGDLDIYESKFEVHDVDEVD